MAEKKREIQYRIHDANETTILVEMLLYILPEEELQKLVQRLQKKKRQDAEKEIAEKDWTAKKEDT